VGNYVWTATYNGDSKNNSASEPATSTEVANETTTTVKAQPAITTNASENGSAAGSATTTDTAHLTGGDHPTGTITFTLTDPAGHAVTLPAADATVTVNGDGDYTTPTAVTATLVGNYVWTATYNGDSKNNSASEPATSTEVANETVATLGGTLAGLTPGFWKNHTSLWQQYSSSAKLTSIFSGASALGSPYNSETLLDAISAGGGGVTALFRMGVAAVLNASDTRVGYPLTVTQIENAVNKAIGSGGSAQQVDDLEGLLDKLNSIEVGIDAHGNPTGGTPTLSAAQVAALLNAYTSKYGAF
jgi:hypothetical protein